MLSYMSHDKLDGLVQDLRMVAEGDRS
jgi:hypothetical protein